MLILFQNVSSWQGINKHCTRKCLESSHAQGLAVFAVRDQSTVEVGDDQKNVQMPWWLFRHILIQSGPGLAFQKYSHKKNLSCVNAPSRKQMLVHRLRFAWWEKKIWFGGENKPPIMAESSSRIAQVKQGDTWSHSQGTNHKNVH